MRPLRAEDRSEKPKLSYYEIGVLKVVGRGIVLFMLSRIDGT